MPGTLSVAEQVTNFSGEKGLDWGDTSVVLSGWAKARMGISQGVVQSIAAAINFIVVGNTGCIFPEISRCLRRHVRVWVTRKRLLWRWKRE